jgi:hypothetical protein
VDAGELQTARDQFTNATRALAIITDELATTRRLCARAEKLVSERRTEAERHRRDASKGTAASLPLQRYNLRSDASI